MAHDHGLGQADLGDVVQDLGGVEQAPAGLHPASNLLARPVGRAPSQVPPPELGRVLAHPLQSSPVTSLPRGPGLHPPLGAGQAAPPQPYAPGAAAVGSVLRPPPVLHPPPSYGRPGPTPPGARPKLVPPPPVRPLATGYARPLPVGLHSPPVSGGPSALPALAQNQAVLSTPPSGHQNAAAAPAAAQGAGAAQPASCTAAPLTAAGVAARAPSAAISRSPRAAGVVSMAGLTAASPAAAASDTDFFDTLGGESWPHSSRQQQQRQQQQPASVEAAAGPQQGFTAPVPSQPVGEPDEAKIGGQLEAVSANVHPESTSSDTMVFGDSTSTGDAHPLTHVPFTSPPFGEQGPALQIERQASDWLGQQGGGEDDGSSFFDSLGSSGAIEQQQAPPEAPQLVQQQQFPGAPAAIPAQAPVAPAAAAQQQEYGAAWQRAGHLQPIQRHHTHHHHDQQQPHVAAQHYGASAAVDTTMPTAAPQLWGAVDSTASTYNYRQQQRQHSGHYFQVKQQPQPSSGSGQHLPPSSMFAPTATHQQGQPAVFMPQPQPQVHTPPSPVTVFNPLAPSHGAAVQQQASQLCAGFAAPHAFTQPQQQQQHHGGQPCEGRPACVTVAFGFGGRVAVIRPGTAVAASFRQVPQPPAPLELHSMQRLASVGRSMTDAGGASGRGGPGGGGIAGPGQQQQEEEEEYAALRLFPGPLTPGTSKDKVLKFVAERTARCVEQEGWGPQEQQQQDGDALRLLWGALYILVQHQGLLRNPSPVPGGSSSTQQQKGGPEAQLAELLAGGPQGEQASASVMDMASQQRLLQHVPAEAPLHACASQVQLHLLAGRRAEALRTAMDGGLWGPALLLARHCGDKAFADTAAAMAKALPTAGTPLHTLLAVLSGSGDSLLESGVGNASQHQEAGGALLTLEAVAGLGGGQAVEPGASLLQAWRSHVAVLAANRSTGDERMLQQMGDLLWQRGGLPRAAHLCYLLGGCPPLPFECTSRMCLLGADHRAAPRTYAGPAAVQRTEIMEWARSKAGQQQPSPALLPYMVQYAWLLAQYGLISTAVQYCQVVCGAVGPKPPPSLLLCRTAAAELQERCQRFAQAHGVSVGGSPAGPSSLMGSLGRWFDRGVHALIGGVEVDQAASFPPRVPSSGMLVSGPTSGDEGGGTRPPSRSLSSHNLQAGPMPMQQQQQQGMMASHGWGSSGALHTMQQQQQQQSATRAVPTAAADAAPEPTPAAMQQVQQQQVHAKPPPSPTRHVAASGNGPASGSGGSGGGGGSVVRSISAMALGTVRNMLGGGAKVREAQLGEDNLFYYNESLGRWVERGKEAEAQQEAEAPPPPPAAAPAPPPPAPAAPPVSSPGGSAQMPSSSTSTGPGANRFAMQRATGARSRYVDTFHPKGSAAVPATPPPAVAPLLPPGAGSPATANGPPCPPVFFVPPGPAAGAAAAAAPPGSGGGVARSASASSLASSAAGGGPGVRAAPACLPPRPASSGAYHHHRSDSPAVISAEVNTSSYPDLTDLTRGEEAPAVVGQVPAPIHHMDSRMGWQGKGQ